MKDLTGFIPPHLETKIRSLTSLNQIKGYIRHISQLLPYVEVKDPTEVTLLHVNILILLQDQKNYLPLTSQPKT